MPRKEKWKDKPGDWWVYFVHRPRHRRKKHVKPAEVVCSNCGQTTYTNNLVQHQRSNKCKIATRERNLEDKGYVKYRSGTGKLGLDIARLQVVVADRSMWVPRWAMITIHSLHKQNWYGHIGNAWAYQEAFNAVQESTDRQHLIERIAMDRGGRQVVAPQLLLTLRKCDMVLQHVLDSKQGFGARDFKRHIIHCAGLIDKFHDAPLGEHLVLAVSAAISHKIVRAKLRQRPHLKYKPHFLGRSKVHLDAVLRRVGGRNVVRPYLEEPEILDE